MDLLNSTVSTTPPIFRQLSFVSPLSSFSINNSSTLTFSKPKKIHIPSQFSSNLALYNRPGFRISAHFGRRSNRRNYLRRKTTEKQLQEVSGNSVISAPISQSETLDLRTVVAPEPTQWRDIKPSTPLRDSVLLDKLEDWVEQYREILPHAAMVEDLSEVNEKKYVAKSLSREMETGKNGIPKNSSVTKFFISDEGKLNGVSGFSLNPSSYKMLPHFGIVILCGLIAMWSMKMLFKVRNNEHDYTGFEKEMLRRKREARMKKEKVVIGSMEVIQESTEHNPILSSERPQFDKEKLVSSITKSRESHNKPALPEHSSSQYIGDAEFEYKIREIREMANQARELEEKGSLLNKEEADSDTFDGLSNENDVVEKPENGSLLVNFSGITEQSAIAGGLSSKPHKDYVKTNPRIIMSVKEAREYLSRKYDKYKETQGGIAGTVEEVDTKSTNLVEKNIIGCVNQKSEEFSDFLKKDIDHERKKSVTQENIATSFEQVDTLPTNLMETKTVGYVNQKSDDSCEKYLPVDNNYVATQGGSAIDSSDIDSGSRDGDCSVSFEKRVTDLVLPLDGTTNDESSSNKDDENLLVSPSFSLEVEASTTCQDSSFTNEPAVPAMEILKDVKERVATSSDILETSSGYNRNDRSQETAPLVNKENWLEKNFHVLEPVVKKMQTGFRDNYLVAKDKSYQELDAKTKSFHLENSKYGGELEWMEDENLKEIVFKVRENELAGRDPFFLMTDEDKLEFFGGLEKKVEQENKQLLRLHEWLHSNIENLDYGTDGISLYDPPQKIMPRWRGPPMEKIQELLNSSVELRKTVDESTKDSSLMKPAKAPKTIIEGSDGSTRAGKKSGKEYWEHTKKWSQGFLDSYNAETDPEIKSVMKDIGKDLDRWITEKEIQEAGELIDKLPERRKKFVRGKIDKVRREMELFGPQAVVSKYREYGDEKEEDYLWWLDLPYILCIEMYIQQEGEMKVGFYSLEMAADLELDPKPNHVIAFEDAGDCKNLCYIIHAHLELLGNGNAFVVAQQPKDAFREAKSNGFGVTVIRKGELQLNVDQPLEEVEEVISEMGSKIYHDKLLQDRGVNIEAVMKGVLGTGNGKPSAHSKASKRKLRKLLESRR